MSHSGSATEVERNTVDKEKASGDKSESLKRPASELSDGKEDSKQKLQKTDKETENGGSEHKDEDIDEDDSKDEDDGPEGEGDDFDEEEGDEDAGDEDPEDEEEDEA